MAGFQAPYIPGWDCHGLPIEHNITKKLGAKAREKSSQEIRLMCRKEAKAWVQTQKEEFMRLGILGHWEEPYLTLDPAYEAEEVREFGRNYKNGVVVRGEKPVYWCIPLRTALAEAEIEYEDHSSPSVYVKFPYEPRASLGSFDQTVSCVIWTTTPWTLPANVALALHPNLEYGFFSTGDETLLIAKGIQEKFEAATGLSLKPPGRFFLGQELEGEKAQHPFMKRESLLVLGDHVTLEAGSGVVHTAPGHGPEDYLLGVKYDLPILSPVGPDGRFTPEVPQYQGLKVFEANEQIIDDLKASGHLLARQDVTHSYPHCWRTKTPLIFRNTSQWFVQMDNEKYPIRKKALAALDSIQFVPEWGVKRIEAMIENRPDWCISRQRNWGVPLPVLYCKDCDHPLVDEAIIEKIADTMEKGMGIESYYDLPMGELTKGLACQACGSKEFQKGKDILDVWFDSGVCHAAVQRKRLSFPADLYLEGSDQHRGWFQTSLLTSVASTGKAPFKALLTHNFINDSKGRKMSKSLGNVVDPFDLIKKSGAELLRLWAASQDYGQDINYSQEGFQRVTETYRRLRNTMRFLLGNLGDFDYEKDQVSAEKRLPLDQWILDQAYQFMEKTQTHYDRFEFYKVYQALNHFFTVDLSNHYLDMIKDRLYTWKKEGLERRSCQTAIYLLTEALIKIMAPLTSFLSEEAYGYFPGRSKETIFMEAYPKPPESWKNFAYRQQFDALFSIRSEVSKKLEEARVAKEIGSSLEAQIKLQLPPSEEEVVRPFSLSMLKEFFIVSHIDILQGPEIHVQVQKASGEKCPRCWNYATLTETGEYGPICNKCVEALY